MTNLFAEDAMIRASGDSVAELPQFFSINISERIVWKLIPSNVYFPINLFCEFIKAISNLV